MTTEPATGYYRLGPPREACSIGLPGVNTFWNRYPEWVPAVQPGVPTRKDEVSHD